MSCFRSDLKAKEDRIYRYLKRWLNLASKVTSLSQITVTKFAMSSWFLPWALKWTSPPKLVTLLLAKVTQTGPEWNSESEFENPWLLAPLYAAEFRAVVVRQNWVNGLGAILVKASWMMPKYVTYRLLDLGSGHWFCIEDYKCGCSSRVDRCKI